MHARIVDGGRQLENLRRQPADRVELDPRQLVTVSIACQTEFHEC